MIEKVECSNCGHAFEDPNVRAVLKRRDPFGGDEHEPHDFCPSCDADLTAIAAATPSPRKKGKKPRWAIRLVGLPDGTDSGFAYHIKIVNPWEGYWLAAYDPEGNAGLGRAVFELEVAKALTFGSFEEAKDCWFQQSFALPRISDYYGDHENRPLSVVSISIDEV